MAAGDGVALGAGLAGADVSKVLVDCDDELEACMGGADVSRGSF